MVVVVVVVVEVVVVVVVVGVVVSCNHAMVDLSYACFSEWFMSYFRVVGRSFREFCLEDFGLLFGQLSIDFLDICSVGNPSQSVFNIKQAF